MNEIAQNQREESMEDILSSIRETVEEEVAKEKKASKVSEAASDDDVLDLTDMMTEDDSELSSAEASFDPSFNAEGDLVDINAFANSGESQKADEQSVKKARARYTGQVEEDEGDDLLKENTSTVEEVSLEAEATETSPSTDVSADMSDDMDIDVDSIMAEMAGEGMVDSADAAAIAAGEEVATIDVDEDGEIDIDALLAEGNAAAPAEEAEKSQEEAVEAVEAEAAEMEDGSTDSEVEEETSETEEVDMMEEEIQDLAASVAEKVAPAVANNVRKVHLQTIPTASGLQLSFPSEVLAEALRPLVSDWIDQNLANVVERLVREELSKLADK